ncbi:DUF4397 domain-containing protein [Clostridium uliginosum]|uniref:DUF4397 domain-containing protein n=1 Tax=Clostridium uliginosum TaxID=119641 RepID=A0A1I1RRI6_9CLOT|nr:DUF4397 domain-containing protein [Clostridium uliginosum]SFD33170.1 protein of unknown function [Clostridium uliginosum]
MLLFRNSLPDLMSNIRFIHAIPSAPNVDIYANGSLLYSNLAFGQVTEYMYLAPGKYNIQLYKTSTYDDPIISMSIELLPNNMITINITYQNKEIKFFTVNDTITSSNPLLSFVRFINLSPNSPLLSLMLPEGTVLFSESAYLETNEYYPISPGIYNFIVSSSDNSFSKFISNIDLQKGVFITIYIVGLMNDSPQVGYILIKDGVDKKMAIKK